MAGVYGGNRLGMAERSGEPFEALIHRILAVSEGGSALVERDVRVPDPDSPEDERQVDIRISKGGLTTFVECRDRMRPQHVQWIEDLIGRRQSLKCDLIIGVSSSGFTRLAKKKAESHGILLRRVSNISDREIREWGAKVRLDLRFVTFRQFDLAIAPSFVAPSDVSRYLERIKTSGELAGALHAELAKVFGKNNAPDEFEMKARIRFGQVAEVTDGCEGFDAAIFARGRVGSLQRQLAAAKVYSAENELTQKAGIANYFAFTEGAGDLVSVASSYHWHLDLSSFRLPPNSISLGDVRLDFGRPEEVVAVSITGAPDPISDAFLIRVCSLPE